MGVRARLLRAIAAQELLRGSLPQDVVDAVVAALRGQLDARSSDASRTVHGIYYSSSGGRAVFARGCHVPGGRPGVRRPALDREAGTTSPFVSQLPTRDVVTTLKSTVDNVVTEGAVAELRGRSIRERAAALTLIAHPDHRDALGHAARRLRYL